MVKHDKQNKGIKEIYNLKYNKNKKIIREKAYNILDLTNQKKSKKILKFTDLNSLSNKKTTLKFNNFTINFDNNIETDSKTNNYNTKSLHLFSNKKIINNSNNNINNEKLYFCKCNSINCLKNYCECFKNGNTCSKSCVCKNCKNLYTKERNILYNIKYVRKEFLNIKKKLFEDDFLICKCSKSCDKKYCPCFKNNNKCFKKCQCYNCKNI